MLDHFKTCVLSQFEAALWMLNDCIQKCPAEHWAGPTSIIGKYEFWHVAHHTLACTDYYLSPGDAEFIMSREFYPGGEADFESEYPSRRMERDELIRFMQHCLAKLRAAVNAETPQSFAGPCGFKGKNLSRAEMYLYNMRHVMHHTGQLSAMLRRHGADAKWGYAGWK